MRGFKKAASAVLAAAMCVGMSVSAFAAQDDAAGIAIKENSRITYDILQVFTGQYAEMTDGKVLSNVKWGQNGTGETGTAVSDSILNELQALVVGEDGTVTNQDGKAGDVNLQRLDVIKKYVDENSTAYRSALADIDAVKNESLGTPGYYLVRVTPGTVSNAEAYPSYTVRVTGDKIGSDFQPKTGGVPTIEKKIDGAYTNKDAAYGDTVSFTITSVLPTNMHDYKEYFWAVTDTMDASLMWDSVVSATIGGKDVKDELSVRNESVDDSQVITVMGFNNIKAIAGIDNFDGAEVKIVYKASVLYGQITPYIASVASDDNTNEVVLEYSSDPNHSGNGTRKNNTDETPAPESDHPTKHTVEGKDTVTHTWVTELVVEHFAADGVPMTDAKFELSGSSLNAVITVSRTYTLLDDMSMPMGPTYWKLKDGRYTETAPTEDTKDEYDNINNRYECVVSTETGSGNTSYTAVIGEDGSLVIKGLKSGTYTLTNTEVPDGYNLAEPITFAIGFEDNMSDDYDTNYTSELFTCDNDKVQERTPERFYVTIVANEGTLLPETGGMGVYFLYGGGALLLVAACGLGFMKLRRKNSAAA